MNPLITSIIELELALDVRVTNEPINRARGNHAQADAEKESAADLRRALKILKGAKRIKNALDMLGLALTEHGHKWQPEERASYEKASRILANVPSHLSRLLLASEPAPQAKCQKCRRHGIRCTGSLALICWLSMKEF